MRIATLVLLITMAIAGTPPASKKPLTAAATMTLREKIAQLIIAPCYGENPNVQSADYRKFVHWVRDLKVGGQP